ncbi:MAG: DUF2490 domain-containing protein [Bacteroidales bacterium]|nr:DUF2490 domain-containing protein [Bacteroidales bacterium]OJX90735.1 MAG: hypothetical protein BGP01_05025 [Paludibacter sp. 47-17]
MRNKVILFLGCCLPLFISAQESEPGGMWTAINIEKNITKQWSTGLELEYRSKGFTLERDRFAAQLGTDYELIKNLKIGASYSWLNVDDDYKFSDDSIRTDYFQNRHRFNLQATWKFKVGNFSFQFRERAQGTFKDDSDRLKSNGKVNANRINPEYVWRNRFKVSYGRKKMPWSPYASVETYYLLNEPESIRFYNSAATGYTEKGSYFTKLRYTLGLEYKINKQHSVELYGMYSHERGVEKIEVMRPTFDSQGMFTGLENDEYYGLANWTNDYVIGVGYTFSF